MANCPNCGSDHIQIKRETDVNWGRALVGYAAFGVVGGAVGAVTGEGRNVNGCLDCGCTWKAEDLYKLLQFIKKVTDRKLDLGLEEDRACMNNFLSLVSPFMEKLSRVEEQSFKSIEDVQKQKNANDNGGFAWGCMTFMFSVMIPPFTVGVVFSWNWFFGSLFFSLIMAGIAQIVASSNKAAFEKQVEATKKQCQKEYQKAEDELNTAIAKFKMSYS